MKTDNFVKQDEDCSSLKGPKFRCQIIVVVIPYFHVGKVYSLPFVRRKQFGFRRIAFVLHSVVKCANVKILITLGEMKSHLDFLNLLYRKI